MENRIAITSIEKAKPMAPIVLRGNIPNCVKIAGELGYDALEIHVRKADELNVQAIKTKCKQKGINISAIVTGQIYILRGFSLVSNDSENREHAIREIKECIDLAAALDAKDGIVIGWIRGKKPDDDNGSYDDVLAEGLLTLSEYAYQKGQRMLIEVLNRYETNVFNRADETLDYINRYNLKNFFVHLDTFHMNIEEADMGDAIRVCGTKLGYLHLADSNRLYPGAGHIDFTKIVQALKEIKYTGSISVECIPLPNTKKAALNALENIKKLMQK